MGLIGPYRIRRKRKKENLNLKAITIIDRVTVWFEIAQFEYKIEISISSLVETMWSTRYPGKKHYI